MVLDHGTEDVGPIHLLFLNVDLVRVDVLQPFWSVTMVHIRHVLLSAIHNMCLQ